MNRAAPEAKRNMGEPAPRLDGRLKVTGEARYASDFPVANPAYAFLVTSAIAKGHIEKMELANALAVPGVIDILTYQNVEGLNDVKASASGGSATPFPIATALEIISCLTTKQLLAAKDVRLGLY